MIVVGLSGKAGSGKTEVANYLVEKHGFTKLSFATPLKKMLRTLDPIVGSQLVLREGLPQPIRLSDAFGQRKEDERAVKGSYYGDEYRRLLQVLGTDCIRAIDEDFWVRAAMKQLTDPDGRYVFDDVRFPNEAEAIQYWGDCWDTNPDHVETRVWRVVRPNHDGGAGAHESEQHEGSMGETLTLTNFSSKLTTLHEQIDYTMAQHFEGVPA